MTYKQIILNYLQEVGTWVEGFKLEKVQTKWGWLGSSGQRRARELAEEGKIERKVENGYVWYRAKPIQYRTAVISHPITGEKEIIQLR